MSDKTRHSRLLIFVSLIPWCAHSPAQIERATYDNENYCTIEYVQIKNEWGNEDCRPRFNVTINGISRSIAVTSGTQELLNCDLGEVVYKNSRVIWIVNRLGRRLDVCLEYDLLAQKVVHLYYGKRFSISPDKEHVAYIFPGSSTHALVFVDDKLVYPVLVESLSEATFEGPRNREGKRYGDLIVENAMASKTETKRLRTSLLKPLDWLSSDTVRLVIGEKVKQEEQEKDVYKSIDVKSFPDFGSPVITTNILTSKPD